MQLPEVHAVIILFVSVITSFANYGNGPFKPLYKCCLTIYYLSVVELQQAFLGVIPSIGHIYIAKSMNCWLPS